MYYEFDKIEQKWQDYWAKNKTFKTDAHDKSRPKYYVLDMFPYPSGSGLHVGHPEGYTASDIMARYKRMTGHNVLHPMGWDSFGLPTENYAIKTKTHPKVITKKNIANFKRQLQMLGLSYDWDREITTSSIDYYKWTQWIFVALYNKGLAYESEISVNWCPHLKTVLANEEVNNGKSEIGSHPVIKKPMKQWMLRITEYADRLLKDLDDVDWPESIKELQRNWIGKSEGASVIFEVENERGTLKIFTTRPDTLFGATYMVVAPEHKILQQITSEENKKSVQSYINETSLKSDLERTDLNKNKSGVFTGSYAINPLNKKRIPIWVADYVLISYGTGAIMSVPAHDQRDWEFAKKFGLPIIPILEGGNIEEEAYTKDGKHINSDFLNELNTSEAISTMIAWLEKNKSGKKTTNYRLRDWLFSRQRYWGEPFPILKFEDGSIRCLDKEELPVKLPEVEQYTPSGTGESPLATIDDWLYLTDPKTGKKARRETNTMPQWAGSCWYYLRFIDPKNKNSPWEEELEKYWMPVDLYVGGVEHAVLHLLYARFWHKVLFDLNLVSTKEPFQKLVNQGMILGEDGEKMSKSRGNVINPDDIIKEYGADSLRLYEMFMGPLEKVKPWQTNGIKGVYNFLKKSFSFYGNIQNIIEEKEKNQDTLKLLHKTIKKVTLDIENMRFNTAISAMMIMNNQIIKEKRKVSLETAKAFTLLLSPFAPHAAEEMWSNLGEKKSLATKDWPQFDEELSKDDLLTIVIQVNGKKRSILEVPADISREELLIKAKANKQVVKFLTGTIIKEIYVPGRICNIIIKR